MQGKGPLSYTTRFETVRGIGSLLAPADFEYVTEIPADTPESQVIIHLSCMAHYTPQVPHLAKQILRKIGIESLIVGGPENCCGELHKHANETDLEKQSAKIAMFGFRQAKPRTVLSICPDCVQNFHAHGIDRLPFQYGGISNLFIEHLDRLKAFMRPVDLRVITHVHTINDEALLDADNMLAILRAIPGVEIIEARHARGPGIHCQTMLPMPPEDQARMCAEARDLKADAIVVPYHSCYRQHCKTEIEYGVTVHHYFNILAMALGIPFTEPFKEMRLLGDVDLVMEALQERIKSLGYDEATVRAQVKRAIFC
jgi:hypothetical protein